ncbi:protease [Lithospermum erythrorhizon]|uniref:Protease n=1 Tax=Lithospermum erythrorhizon TaxID=34254 RepID=A0AAV3NIR0_LITER
MAFTHNFLIYCFLLFVLPCIAKSSFKPKALILPVTKDASTLQHITYITHKNPLKPIKLVVDLGGHSLWVDCETSYNTSTYKPVNCETEQCKLVMSSDCGDGCEREWLPKCSRDQCFNNIYASYSDEIFPGGLVAEDVILIQSTDGKKLSQVATIKGFIFTCVNNYFNPTLPSGVVGSAAFGSSDIALPTQLAKTFNFPRKFVSLFKFFYKKEGFYYFRRWPLCYPSK